MARTSYFWPARRDRWKATLVLNKKTEAANKSNLLRVVKEDKEQFKLSVATGEVTASNPRQV